MVEEIWAEFYLVIVGLKNYRVVVKLSVFEEKIQVLLGFFIFKKIRPNESFGFLIFNLMNYSAF
jgi:hypothetical protein